MKLSGRSAGYKSALLLTGIVLCAFGAFAQSKLEQRVTDEVSQARLLAGVRDLVRFGPRIGGTSSGDKASSYVTHRFEEAGYKPAVIKDPSRLSFEFKKWTLAVAQPESLRTLISNEWIGAFSPSTAPSVSELIYLKDPASVSRSTAANKAILTGVPFSDKEYRRMADCGATCILEISPHLEDAYSDWAFINDLPPSKKNPIPLFNLSYKNGQRLIAALDESVRVLIRFSAKTLIDSTRPRTVMATLDGESKQYYLVCAHGDSDSGGPGADDNASGVSTVLETARVLKKLVTSRYLQKPKYSIRFIAWGSEIFSTENYVRQHAKELDSIRGVLNLDEVGIGGARNCLYFESNDIKQNESLLRTLDSIGTEYSGKKGFWSEATTNPSQGGTDSYVFLPEYLRSLKVHEAKIPSVTIYTAAWNELKPLAQTRSWSSLAWHGPRDTVYVDYSPYYHSSLDIPQRTTETEPFNMVGAAKAVVIALLRVAW